MFFRLIEFDEYIIFEHKNALKVFEMVFFFLNLFKFGFYDSVLKIL